MFWKRLDVTLKKKKCLPQKIQVKTKMKEFRKGKKLGVMFGHKMHAVRACALDRCEPWRSGLRSLTVGAKRDMVKCSMSAR